MASRPRRQDSAAKPGIGDLLVQFADPLVQLAGVEALTGQKVPAFLRLGAVGDQVPLLLGRRVRVDDGFMVEVPAFAALRGPQDPGPLRARRAHRGQGVPARDQDLLDVAGVDLGPAQLHRPQACAVLGGQVLDHLAGQRCRHPLGPRRPPRASPVAVRQVGGVEGPGVAAQAAFGPQDRLAGVDQDQAGAADRAGFVGAPGGFPHRPPPGR